MLYNTKSLVQWLTRVAVSISYNHNCYIKGVSLERKKWFILFFQTGNVDWQTSWSMINLKTSDTN